MDFLPCRGRWSCLGLRTGVSPHFSTNAILEILTVDYERGRVPLPGAISSGVSAAAVSAFPHFRRCTHGTCDAVTTIAPCEGSRRTGAGAAAAAETRGAELRGEKARNASRERRGAQSVPPCPALLRPAPPYPATLDAIADRASERTTKSSNERTRADDCRRHTFSGRNSLQWKNEKKRDRK